MSWHERIVRDPQILCGKPVVNGARISVELLLARLADGWTQHKVLSSHPHLSEADLRALLGYAAELVRCSQNPKPQDPR